MQFISVHFQSSIAVLLVALSICACGTHATSEKDFVGKWKSTKLETPIYLYENGEWEVKSEDGKVLQYGIWQYEGNKIRWTYKIRSQISHELNEVLSASSSEFQLKELDGTTTTFSRLDQN